MDGAATGKPQQANLRKIAPQETLFASTDTPVRYAPTVIPPASPDFMFSLLTNPTFRNSCRSYACMANTVEGRFAMQA
jgi:hypothetical protein